MAPVKKHKKVTKTRTKTSATHLTVRKTKKKVKRVKKVKVEKYVRGTLIKSIYAFFDDKGVDKCGYVETLELARKIKPGTPFNKYHMAWYKNDYKNRRDLP